MQFEMLGRSVSSEFKSTVYLNIYDLTPLNNYLYWFGIGFFHSAIEINGVEYAYGAHDQPSSGIFEVEPRKCPGFIFRRSIPIGTTDLTPADVWGILDDMSVYYTGDSYNLLAKNCNHFTNDFCVKLIGKSVPGWVNRLANLGTFCSCVLPDSFQVTGLPQPLEYRSSEDAQSPLTDQEWLDNSDDEVLLLPHVNDKVDVQFVPLRERIS